MKYFYYTQHVLFFALLYFLTIKIPFIVNIGLSLMTVSYLFLVLEIKSTTYSLEFKSLIDTYQKGYHLPLIADCTAYFILLNIAVIYEHWYLVIIVAILSFCDFKLRNFALK